MSVKSRKRSAHIPDIHKEDVSSLNCKATEYSQAGIPREAAKVYVTPDIEKTDRKQKTKPEN